MDYGTKTCAIKCPKGPFSFCQKLITILEFEQASWLLHYFPGQALLQNCKDIILLYLALLTTMREAFKLHRNLVY